MKNFLAAALLLLLFLVPAKSFAQKYGNFTIDANKKIYFEKVFDAPGLSAAQLQPIIVSKLSSQGIYIDVAADKIITARYKDYDMVTSTKKTKLITFNDGWRHFFGIVKVELKDGRYRVKVTEMQNYIVNDMFTMEQIYNTKKPAKQLGKVLQKWDDYFVAFFSVSGDDNW